MAGGAATGTRRPSRRLLKLRWPPARWATPTPARCAAR